MYLETSVLMSNILLNLYDCTGLNSIRENICIPARFEDINNRHFPRENICLFQVNDKQIYDYVSLSTGLI
jgi:hypothetical protein